MKFATYFKIGSFVFKLLKARHPELDKVPVEDIIDVVGEVLGTSDKETIIKIEEPPHRLVNGKIEYENVETAYRLVIED